MIQDQRSTYMLHHLHTSMTKTLLKNIYHVMFIAYSVTIYYFIKQALTVCNGVHMVWRIFLVEIHP